MWLSSSNNFLTRLMGADFPTSNAHKISSIFDDQFPSQKTATFLLDVGRTRSKIPKSWPTRDRGGICRQIDRFDLFARVVQLNRTERKKKCPTHRGRKMATLFRRKPKSVQLDRTRQQRKNQTQIDEITFSLSLIFLGTGNSPAGQGFCTEGNRYYRLIVFPRPNCG